MKHDEIIINTESRILFPVEQYKKFLNIAKENYLKTILKGKARNARPLV